MYKFLLGFFVLFSVNFVLPQGAHAIEFSIQEKEDGRTVLIVYDGYDPLKDESGHLEYGDERKFRNVVLKNPEIKEIWLSSGGGSVSASYAMGRLIRAKRFMVVVPSLKRMRALAEHNGNDPKLYRYVKKLGLTRGGNLCASACGMLLAGGIVRFIDEPHLVGLHSATAMGDGRAKRYQSLGQHAKKQLQKVERTHQQIGVEWVSYMTEMGIDNLYVDIASQVKQSCMYYISSVEMDKMNVTNVRGHKTEGGNSRGLCVCRGYPLGYGLNLCTD